jgi:hypothetical protein
LAERLAAVSAVMSASWAGIFTRFATARFVPQDEGHRWIVEQLTGKQGA